MAKSLSKGDRRSPSRCLDLLWKSHYIQEAEAVGYEIWNKYYVQDLHLESGKCQPCWCPQRRSQP